MEALVLIARAWEQARGPAGGKLRDTRAVKRPDAGMLLGTENT